MSDPETQGPDSAAGGESPSPSGARCPQCDFTATGPMFRIRLGQHLKIQHGVAGKWKTKGKPEAKDTARHAVKPPTARMAAIPDGAADPWQRLGYPDLATYARITKEHSDLAYDVDTDSMKPFLSLPPWLRLGWPRDLWRRCQTIRVPAERVAAALDRLPDPDEGDSTISVVTIPYARLKALYPDRNGIARDEQDFPKMIRYWPDALGFPMRDVQIALSKKEVITINDLHYAPGHHRVPEPVATQLLEIATRSNAELLKALIPRTHAEEILATLSMASG